MQSSQQDPLLRLTAPNVYTDRQTAFRIRLIHDRLSLLRYNWEFNPSQSRDNYSATSDNMKLVHWPLMGGPLHLVQLGGYWAGYGIVEFNVPLDTL